MEISEASDNLDRPLFAAAALAADMAADQRDQCHRSADFIVIASVRQYAGRNHHNGALVWNHTDCSCKAGNPSVSACVSGPVFRVYPDVRVLYADYGICGRQNVEKKQKQVRKDQK